MSQWKELPRKPASSPHSSDFTDWSAQTTDPLPTWVATAPKQAITALAEKIAKEGSADFDPPADRIATQPMEFQFFFALNRVKAPRPGRKRVGSQVGGSKVPITELPLPTKKTGRMSHSHPAFLTVISGCGAVIPLH